MVNKTARMVPMSSDAVSIDTRSSLSVLVLSCLCYKKMGFSGMRWKRGK